MIITLRISISYSQGDYSILREFRDGDFSSISEKIKNSHLSNQMVKWRLNFLQDFEINDEKYETIKTYTSDKKENILEQFLYFINLGDYYFYKHEDGNFRAQQEY